MTQDKDKIQQAADALDALGAGAAPAGPPDQPAQDTPAQPPAPSAAAQPAVPVPPPVPSDPNVVSVVVRFPHKARPPRPGPAAPAASDDPTNAQPSPPKLRPLARTALTRKIALRRTLIPILLSTGLVMILLGLWAVVVLAGGKDPFKGEVTFQTRYLARLMLLAWPIAAILLAGTAFLMYEVYNHYRIHHPQQPPPAAPDRQT